MSLEECNSCNACHGKCDKCTLDVCLKNMENHKEIYKLTNSFQNKLNEAFQNLYDRCVEIKNSLHSDYGINIEISSLYDKFFQSEDFLNKLNIKRCEAQDYIDKIRHQMEQIKKDNSNKINEIHALHTQNKNEIDNIFKEEEKKYEIIETNHNDLINSKKQIIDKLIKEKDSIFIDVDKIVNSFIEEERKNIEKEFENNKIEINKNNFFIDEELKYSNEEIEKKNEYLNEIKKIKNYSDKIPNYENWIIGFNLNKYKIF